MGEGAYAKVYKANLMVETEYEFENEEKVIKVVNFTVTRFSETYFTQNMSQTLPVLVKLVRFFYPTALKAAGKSLSGLYLRNRKV